MTRGMVRGGIAAAVLAAGIICAPALWAQMGGSQKSQQQQPQQPQTPPTTQPGQQQQNPPPAEPPKDPEEEKAYKAFYDTNVAEPDKIIELGVPFAEKYPKSRYVEQVYSRLTQAYYNKQNLPKMYEYGDKALALDANDVTVLTLVGWVIPHDTSQPNFEEQLKKAEGYEKRALEKLGTLEKPGPMTDEQFAKAKKEYTSQAHSGLGLIYFREGKPADAVTELKAAVEGAATPDPTDYYVMGLQLEKLNKEADAADAYGKCAAVANALQSRCKQSSEDAKKKAASQPK